MQIKRSCFEHYQKNDYYVCFREQVIKASELTYQDTYRNRKNIVLICKRDLLDDIARNTIEQLIFYSITSILDRNPALKIDIVNKFGELKTIPILIKDIYANKEVE